MKSQYLFIYLFNGPKNYSYNNVLYIRLRIIIHYTRYNKKKQFTIAKINNLNSIEVQQHKNICIEISNSHTVNLLVTSFIVLL